MMLLRLRDWLFYGILATLGIVLAGSLQMAKVTQLGLVGFIFGLWLLYVLVDGISTRSGLLFSALFYVKPIPISFYCVFFIIVFSLVGEYYRTGRRGFKIPYPFAAAVLAATCVFGLARAREFGDAFIYFMSTLAVPFLLMTAVANSDLEERDLLAWMKLVVLVGALLGLIGVPMGMLSPEERYGSLWITAMTINGFYTLSFFFAIALSNVEKSQNLKYLWWACALLIFLGMLYTYTRIALLAVFFGFFLLMLRMKRFRYIGMLMLLFIPLIIPSSMMTRIQLGFSFDISIFIRFLAWYHALDQIRLNPFFGIGISVWKEWYMGIIPFDFLYAEHPHNLYLKIMLEIGIFGFLAYFYMIGAALVRHFKACVRGSGSGFDYIVMTGMLAVLFACLTDIFIQQYEISPVFWTTLAFLYLRGRGKALASHEE